MPALMKTPGPDHPITITPQPGRVRVRAGDRTIAETTHALRLEEARLPPVLYIPREDADMSALRRTDHHTHCPYKGDASYFSLEGAENAVWSYEAPYPPAARITEHLAFYPDKVRIEVLPGRESA